MFSDKKNIVSVYQEEFQASSV
uniref:Uncharacterized protein n=1 Tax=Moniliophthora roreri TaxID=221103 RepID=A0A0W0EYW3_MONRR